MGQQSWWKRFNQLKDQNIVSEKKLVETGSNIGQFLAIVGLILVYGVGAFWLCQELITDAQFARTGDPEDKVPLFIRFGVPTMIIGIGILFFTVLFQRLKAAKTDKYRDVQI